MGTSFAKSITIGSRYTHIWIRVHLSLCSPDDPRVLEALGACYMELNKKFEAKKVSTCLIMYVTKYDTGDVILVAPLTRQ